MRRPIATRGSDWAARLAAELAERRVSPNLVSMASVAFAALGLALMALSAGAGGLGTLILLWLAAACCQARLVCNLLDGMVAVEGRLAEPDGAFWNEAPDRAADLLLLAGAGIAAGAAALGWAAGAAAVLTAYVRELGRAEGQAADFGGPMAKQHRMAVLTAALLAAPVFGPWSGTVLEVGLWIVLLGSFLTAGKRARRIVGRMRAG